MKYLVMDTKFSYAILLDEMGHMVYAANKDYEIGQKISDPYIINAPLKKPWLKIGLFLTPVFALAALLLFINISTSQIPTLFAKIYLTINPEVAISVDYEGEVFALEGLDEDGRILIEDYDFKNKDETEVTRELILRASEMSFLKEGMTITIEFDNEEALKRFGADIRQEATSDLDLAVDLKIVKKGALDDAQEVEVTKPQEQPQDTEAAKEELRPAEPTPISPNKEPTAETPPAPITNNDSNYQASSNYDNYQNSNYDTDGNDSNYQNSDCDEDNDSNYAD